MALAGLESDNIELKFWSIYLIMQLAQNHGARANRSNDCFAPALPLLLKIAATDHRLAPGYWWPISAEAEDALHIIEHGNSPECDAADRWSGATERGPMNRD